METNKKYEFWSNKQIKARDPINDWVQNQSSWTLWTFWHVDFVDGVSRIAPGQLSIFFQWHCWGRIKTIWILKQSNDWFGLIQNEWCGNVAVNNCWTYQKHQVPLLLLHGVRVGFQHWSKQNNMTLKTTKPKLDAYALKNRCDQFMRIRASNRVYAFYDKLSDQMLVKGYSTQQVHTITINTKSACIPTYFNIMPLVFKSVIGFDFWSDPRESITPGENPVLVPASTGKHEKQEKRWAK